MKLNKTFPTTDTLILIFLLYITYKCSIFTKMKDEN